MREPKKLKASPTTGGAGNNNNGSSDNGLPVSSPLNRQPKTPSTGPDTPGSRSELPWPPKSQTPNSQARALSNSIKAESVEMPPPTPEPAAACTPLSMRSPGPGGPTPSPLDQFKKEDPIEKMANMASSLNGVGIGGPHSLRPPSAAPGTPSSYIPLSPGPNLANHLRSNLVAGGCPPGSGSMSPHPPHLMMPGGGGGGMGGGMPLQMQMTPQPQQMMHQHPHQQQPQQPHPNHGNPPADQPYLPNQNYIYVFDTELANYAAQDVISNRVQNIVEFHQQLPATKNFLNHFQMEGRTFNMSPQQRSQMMSAGLMHNNQRPQMRPDFGGGGGVPSAHQQVTKDMKLQKIRQLRDQIGMGNGNPQVAPPPYPAQGGGPGPVPMMPGGGGMMLPARPVRPAGSGRNSKRATAQMEATVTLEEVNYEAQHQHAQMEMMVKREGPSAGTFSGDGLYGQPLQQSCGMDLLGKEGNMATVMPVPSPQPIQYISGQLDQEVVIQKQPNRNFLRGGPANGGPRGMPPMNGPRMRGMAPINVDQQQQHQGMSSMTMQQHAQFQQQQHFSSQPFHPGQQPQGQCMSDMPQRHPGPSNGASHSPNQMFQAQQFEASIRAQFHGSSNSTLPGGPMMGHQKPPQTVNNTYVNANIAIEHVNIQNIPGAFENGGGGAHFQTHGGQGSVNFASDMQHMMNQGPPVGYQTSFNDGSFPGGGGGGVGPSPQVSIRTSAPHTIQYGPNRPPPPKQTRPPPNLDFLQPWTGGGGGASGPPQPPPLRGPMMSGGPQQPQHMSSGGFMQQQQPSPQMYAPSNGGGGGLPSQHLLQQQQQPDYSLSHQIMGGGVGNSNSEPAYAPGYQAFQEQLYASNTQPSSARQQQQQALQSSPQQQLQQTAASTAAPQYCYGWVAGILLPLD
uniref:Putative enabled n=1 Tax=Hypsibius dujardini TaxID=232323 RepID=A0A0U3BN00_HYPDU|nr:putative enabled [Hypsibius dujardini]